MEQRNGHTSFEPTIGIDNRYHDMIILSSITQKRSYINGLNLNCCIVNVHKVTRFGKCISHKLHATAQKSFDRLSR